MSGCGQPGARLWGDTETATPPPPPPLPTPTQAGQVLYAETIAAFTIQLPIIGPQGWLTGGGKMLVK